MQVRHYCLVLDGLLDDTEDSVEGIRVCLTAGCTTGKAWQ